MIAYVKYHHIRTINNVVDKRYHLMNTYLFDWMFVQNLKDVQDLKDVHLVLVLKHLSLYLLLRANHWLLWINPRVSLFSPFTGLPSCLVKWL